MHIFLPLLVAFNLSVLGDGLSTHAAIARGGREVNPLGRSHPYVMLWVSAAATDAASIWLYTHDHPRLALLPPSVGIGAHGFAVVWNLQVGR